MGLPKSPCIGTHMERLSRHIPEPVRRMAQAVMYGAGMALLYGAFLLFEFRSWFPDLMRRILKPIPSQFVLPLFLVGGIAVGLGGYTTYMSRAWSYLSDDPAACVNCHIMAPYYQSWNHSSHALWATCNDCHVPEGFIAGYSFKALDGLYHAAMFTLKAEPQVIRPRDASNKVILQNCNRCHTQLNTEFVNTGRGTMALGAEARLLILVCGTSRWQSQQAFSRPFFTFVYCTMPVSTNSVFSCV